MYTTEPKKEVDETKMSTSVCVRVRARMCVQLVRYLVVICLLMIHLKSIAMRIMVFLLSVSILYVEMLITRTDKVFVYQHKAYKLMRTVREAY